MHPPHPPREPVNGWIHFCGAILAAVGLGALVGDAAAIGSPRHLVAAAVFGASAVGLFTASAVYHLRPRSPRATLYQRLDHAMIYVFIAATYTPLCLVTFWPSVLGRVLLVTVWALALAGVLLELRPRRLPRGVATGIYLGLGWAGALALPALLHLTSTALLKWMLVGGVLYSVGAVLYWRQWPRGWHGRFGFHEMWHVCVLGASAAHYWAIRAYVLAAGGA